MGLLRSCSRLLAIAAIVAAGLVVGACSGGSNSSNVSSSSTPTTTPYVSAQATVIGKSTVVVVNPAVSAALKRAGITVTGKINRKNFGLTWSGTTETGSLIVSDEVRLHVALEFVKA